jgi:hypothetical protein
MKCNHSKSPRSKGHHNIHGAPSRRMWESHDGKVLLPLVEIQHGARHPPTTEVQVVGATTIRDTSFASSLGEYFFPFICFLISCISCYILALFVLKIMKTQKDFSCFFFYLLLVIYIDRLKTKKQEFCFLEYNAKTELQEFAENCSLFIFIFFL